MKEKKYLIYGIGIVLITLIGVTLAYFMSTIEGDKKSVTVSTGDLRVIFNNGENIEGVNIEPGWSITKTFSIENKSNTEYKYNLVIEDLINTFVSDNLVYKITSTNNGYNMTDYEVLPKFDTKVNKILTYSTPISGKTKQEYTIEIKFLEEDRNQYEDMGSTISGNLYISEGTEEPTLAQAILRDNPTVSERTIFNTTYTENTTGTIFKTNRTEDDSYVYYYSGNTTNNWVKFGKYQSDSITYRGYSSSNSSYFREYSTLEECNNASSYNYNCTLYKYASAGDDIYWRIIRTNEDGSARLLYSGTSPDTTEGYIGISAFNTNSNDPMYVGYMYGTSGSLENNRQNTNDSTVKTVIDKWYEDNLLTNYDKYISKAAIYCNDRSIGEGTYSTSSEFDYGAYTRVVLNNKASYKCGANAANGLFESTQAIADKFSASTTGGGNGQLKYPIAMMTIDELVFAGGRNYTELPSPYAWYYTNNEGNSIIGSSYWWSLSPYLWNSHYANVWGMSGSVRPGYLDNNNITYDYKLRPVVSLDSCVTINKGNGTATVPYEINKNSCN